MKKGLEKNEETKTFKVPYANVWLCLYISSQAARTFLRCFADDSVWEVRWREREREVVSLLLLALVCKRPVGARENI